MPSLLKVFAKTFHVFLSDHL